MNQQNLTPEDKKLFIDYMLENSELEKTIQNRDKELLLYQISVFNCILSRCNDNAGFIVAVKSNEILALNTSVLELLRTYL